MSEHLAPFPHEGGCAECRAAQQCNACGGSLNVSRCTNGRCSRCHDVHCTPGGATSPGHGFGTIGLGQPHTLTPP